MNVMTKSVACMSAKSKSKETQEEERSKMLATLAKELLKTHMESYEAIKEALTDVVTLSSFITLLETGEALGEDASLHMSLSFYGICAKNGIRQSLATKDLLTTSKNPNKIKKRQEKAKQTLKITRGRFEQMIEHAHRRLWLKLLEIVRDSRSIKKTLTYVLTIDPDTHPKEWSVFFDLLETYANNGNNS